MSADIHRNLRDFENEIDQLRHQLDAALTTITGLIRDRRRAERDLLLAQRELAATEAAFDEAFGLLLRCAAIRDPQELPPHPRIPRQKRGAAA